MSSLVVTTLHFWPFTRVERTDFSPFAGLCGVNIGRFTREVDEVTCNDCLDLIFRTLTRDGGLVIIEERDHDWVAKIAAEPDKWEPSSTPIKALSALVKSRPELLEGMKS